MEVQGGGGGSGGVCKQFLPLMFGHINGEQIGCVLAVAGFRLQHIMPPHRADVCGCKIKGGMAGDNPSLLAVYVRLVGD